MKTEHPPAQTETTGEGEAPTHGVASRGAPADGAAAVITGNEGLEIRRRPSGERPPLPRAFTRADRRVLGVSVAIVLLLAFLGATNRFTAWLDLIDEPISLAVAKLRTTGNVDVAHWISRATGPGAFKIYGLAIFLGLVLLRRNRRWIVLFGALIATYSVQSLFVELTQRPRPFGVEIIGTWAGFAFPSDSVTPFAALTIGACFCFFRAGIRRWLGVTIGLAFLVAMSGSRILLGVDHMTDDLAGILIGASVMLFAFKWFVADSVFPIRPGGGNSAHLDLGGARGEAIRAALADQLGVEVDSIKPFGLEGSAGSTPMLISLRGDADQKLFAKLYTTHHVRADRLYKLGRTLLYGRLEDEASFQTVRRLVEYEDYMMRVMASAGVPVVVSYGVVELTPEREYLLVTDFADGAAEISDAEVVVDQVVIDDVLRAVRRMWDSGLSHRDIKPANLLVRNGRVLLIDVAFGSVRPSPWRQAVDLANAMLVLAVRSDAATVYRAAQKYFAPAEIAEGFAATKGMTVPGELRSRVEADGRDLISEFRHLAPGREPIPIQRWSLRRVGLSTGVALGTLVIAYLIVATVLGPDRGTVRSPECPDEPSVVLAGQSVPSAGQIACLRSLPAGWSLREAVVTEDGMSIAAENDRGGADALEISFRSQCDTAGMTPVDAGPKNPPALRASTNDGTTYTSRTAYPIQGGCALTTLSVPSDTATLLEPEANEIIGFANRSQLDAEVSARTGGRITVI